MAEPKSGAGGGGKNKRSKHRSPGNTTLSEMVEIVQSSRKVFTDTSSQTSKTHTHPRMERRHSEDLPKISYPLPSHLKTHSMVEVSQKGKKRKAKSKPGSKKTSLQETTDTMKGLPITKSGASSSSSMPMLLLPQNSEDEGIHLQSPRSTSSVTNSEGLAASGGKSRNSTSHCSSTSSLGHQSHPSDHADIEYVCGGRNRNSSSHCSSTSSLGHQSHPSDHVDEENVNDYMDEIFESEQFETNIYKDNENVLQQATFEDGSDTPTPIVIAPHLIQRPDLDLDSVSTPVEPHLHIFEHPGDSTIPQLFPAQQSHDVTGDTLPYHTVTPHQETIEGAGLYDKNINRLPTSEDDIPDAEKSELKNFTDILKEATATIVSDNFDRVNTEFNKIIDHYQTQYQDLKREHDAVIREHHAEKQHLSGQIEREKERRSEGVTMQTVLSAEVEKNREEIRKLQNETRQFQQTRDEVHELSMKLKEKEDELHRLRVTMRERSKKMRDIVPIHADPKQLDEMKKSKECLKLLMNIRPDEKKIKEELQRYKNKTEGRPSTSI